MNGVVYNKKISDTVEQGTGDKCLVLEPYTSYEAPFTWGRDWNQIRLGVIWSWTSTTGEDTSDDTRYNTPVTHSGNASDTMEFDYGGIIPETNCFFGISKSGQTSTVPGNVERSGFLGWKGHMVEMSTGSGVYDIHNSNTLGVKEYDSYGVRRVRPELHWIKGNKWNSVSRMDYVGAHARSSFNDKANIAPRIYAEKNPNPSGISPEGEENFASFWGLDVKRSVHPPYENRYNEFEVKPLYKNEALNYTTFEPYGRGDWTPISGVPDGGNFQYASGCRISNPSVEQLTNIINGAGVQSRPTYRSNLVSILRDDDNYRVDTTDFSTYPFGKYDINDPNNPFRVNHQPDSVYFYNGFADLNVRIHSWIAIRIS